MDSTEAFNVSVIENFSFWCLGSVYLNTSPAADVCFAFLPAKPARLFGSWSFCCIITSFTCSSCYAFLQESLPYLVLLSNEPMKVFYFSLETTHSCVWEALKCICSQQLLMCHNHSYSLSFFTRGCALMSICCQQTQELLQNRHLDKTAPRTPGSDCKGWEPSLHLGWGCSASALCGVKGCAVLGGPSSPPKSEMFRFWAIGILVLPRKTYFYHCLSNTSCRCT